MAATMKASVKESYTDRQGKEKSTWTSVGIINENEKGNLTFIVKPKVLLGFLLESIITNKPLYISFFRDEQNQYGQYRE